MKIIQPSASLVTEKNPIKKIEMVGRTCYKSEAAITDESAQKFVDGLISRKHFAMLEHSVIHFKYVHRNKNSIIHQAIVEFANENDFVKFNETAVVSNGDCLDHTDYLTVSFSHLYRPDVIDCLGLQSELRKCVEVYLKDNTNVFPQTDGKIYIINDEDLKIELSSFPDIYKRHMFYSFHFVCDRGVSHELVRHRCSFGQESTRYCNYSKDKFGNELTFIQPSTFDSWPDNMKELFFRELGVIEQGYLDMTMAGLQPQQARAILPNSLKTELVMTAPLYQWLHFINLRSIGTTGAPHPDMKVVADIVYGIVKELEPTYFHN